MKRIFFLWVIVLFSFSAFAQNTTKLLDQYLMIKNALVESDSKTAAKAIIAFQQGLIESKDMPQRDVLLKAVGSMAKTANLEKHRAGFNALSTSFWKAVKADAHLDGQVYYQYCPMKKAYWLSKEKEIKNPYYGASMLTCGNIAETK